MPMDLVVAVKVARTAVKFVEGGPLEEALTELNMTAAAAALRKASDAKDKPAQVWSAVNHLEAAQAALQRKLQKRGKLIATGNQIRFDKLVSKYRYIMGLMALCYSYLDEESLAKQAFANAKKPPKFVHSFFYDLACYKLLIPPLLLPEVLTDSRDRFEVDWENFELPPRGLAPPNPRLA